MDLRVQATNIIKDNNRGHYNVPNNSVYPFQWNWDAGFTAYGWMLIDEERAWQEIETLMLGQWENGMIPHIIFHEEESNYFPNTDIWQIDRNPPTSGITQPPIIACFVTLMYAVSSHKSAIHERVKNIYKKLYANHQWWHTIRNPEKNGLVYIYHPWESGMDNSPEWDVPFTQVPMTDTPFTRKDTNNVHSSERPHDHDYKRYIYIVELARSIKYDYSRYFNISPFSIAHVGVNAILAWADVELFTLAKIFGTDEEKHEIQSWMDKSGNALNQLWNPELQMYSSWNARTKKHIDVPIGGGLLPLLTHDCAQEHIDIMKAHVQTWVKEGRPSTFRHYKDFEPQRYWRGPAWNILDFMVFIACRNQGWEDLATTIKQDSIAMVEQNGFWEYFNSDTHHGCGGSDFSWTAAIYLIMKNNII